MDTLTSSIRPIFDAPACNPSWIVAYSGVSRELTKSGFNVRVEECRRAAAQLKEGAQVLADVPRETFEEKKMALPEDLRKRAIHFFSEVERVRRGATAWQEHDFELFGQLMNRSCESSVYNYESGSEILVELQALVSQTAGVYGSRFSGGGYGGCVVGLARRDAAENACTEIAEKFAKKHPDLPSKVFVAETGDGIFPVLSGDRESPTRCGTGQRS